MVANIDKDIFLNNINRINEFFEKSTEEYKLLDIKYKDPKIRIKVKCPIDEHPPYWVDWLHYYNRGDRCGKCRYIKNGINRTIYTTEKIKEILDNLKLILITENAIGIDTLITVKSEEGYLANTTIYRINKKHFPQYFEMKNPYTIKNIKLWCKLNNKPFELLSNTYERASKKLLWKCKNKNCEEEFKKEWNSIIGGTGCPYCSGRLASKNNNLLLKNPALASEWDYKNNYPLLPENVLPNDTKEYWWKCNECQHKWKQSVHFRNQRNNSCPICTKSKGEKRIIYYLRQFNIDFIQQYKYKDCMYKKQLRFDFYLPDYNLLIEYQGEFHYKIIKGINNKKSFAEQQIRDQIKRDYCKNNNIKLLEIPHWEFNNIEEILNKELILGIN